MNDDFYFRLNGDDTVIPEFSPTDLLEKIDNLEMALLESQIREKREQQKFDEKKEKMLEGTAAMMLTLVNLYKKDVQYPPEESKELIKEAEKALAEILNGRYGRLKEHVMYDLYEEMREKKRESKPRLRILTSLPPEDEEHPSYDAASSA